jgi:hypothetical protein
MRLLLDMVNWHFYNKSLVRRGEVILDFDVIDTCYIELDSMNSGKRGCTVPLSRFIYPTTRLHGSIFSSAVPSSRGCSHGTCR